MMTCEKAAGRPCEAIRHGDAGTIGCRDMAATSAPIDTGLPLTVSSACGKAMPRRWRFLATGQAAGDTNETR
jgi:hypothetical protein